MSVLSELFRGLKGGYKYSLGASKEMLTSPGVNPWEFAAGLRTANAPAAEAFGAEMGTMLGFGGAGLGAAGGAAKKGASWLWSGAKDKEGQFVLNNKQRWGRRATVATAVSGFSIFHTGQAIAADAYGAYHGSDGRKGQMRAIVEQAAYNNNPNIAGFGSAMRFSGGGVYESVIPTASFAKGYSPNALGATGELVLAMHRNSRG